MGGLKEGVVVAVSDEQLGFTPLGLEREHAGCWRRARALV